VRHSPARHHAPVLRSGRFRFSGVHAIPGYGAGGQPAVGRGVPSLHRLGTGGTQADRREPVVGHGPALVGLPQVVFRPQRWTPDAARGKFLRFRRCEVPVPVTRACHYLGGHANCACRCFVREPSANTWRASFHYGNVKDRNNYTLRCGGFAQPGTP